jgi:ligand-binding SRPBCC domain-containing protein
LPYTAQFEQWVPAPLEQVFLFFANPGNLPRIMPPATGTEVVRVHLVPPPGTLDERATVTDRPPLAGAGTELVTSFRVLPFLPFRAQWIALITQFEWNHHFADIQKRGPFKRFQHRHEFEAETRNGVEGTRVHDVIAYDIGFGMLGALAQRLIVARQIRKIFEYRQKALAGLLTGKRPS